MSENFFEVSGKKYAMYIAKLNKKGFKLDFTISNTFSDKNDNSKKSYAIIPISNILGKKKYTKVEIHCLQFKKDETEIKYLYFITPDQIKKEVVETIFENYNIYEDYECKDIRVCKGIYTVLNNSNNATIKIVTKHIDMAKVMYFIIFIMILLVSINLFLLGKGLFEILNIASTLS